MLQRERGYFTANALRMQYPLFCKRGLPVASGAVEGGAKHLVQQRMKRAGMRWSELGARAILHLRCDSLSAAPADHFAA
jgi:tartrate dehydratase beta subunit/fumarate hydratase class I family protein